LVNGSWHVLLRQSRRSSHGSLVRREIVFCKHQPYITPRIFMSHPQKWPKHAQWCPGCDRPGPWEAWEVYLQDMRPYRPRQSNVVPNPHAHSTSSRNGLQIIFNLGGQYINMCLRATTSPICRRLS
jgi:hypothetical protein